MGMRQSSGLSGLAGVFECYGEQRSAISLTAFGAKGNQDPAHEKTAGRENSVEHRHFYR
jgi:hypothetical protein